MLADTRIRNIKPAEGAIRFAGSRGLYLEITPSGGRYWRHRLHIRGKESICTIGEHPLVPLVDARRQLDNARKPVT
jgi:hypothetical protein